MNLVWTKKEQNGRTDMSDVNVSDNWNIVNPMLCEAGE
jgi:hypothetical protein